MIQVLITLMIHCYAMKFVEHRYPEIRPKTSGSTCVMKLYQSTANANTQCKNRKNCGTKITRYKLQLHLFDDDVQLYYAYDSLIIDIWL